MIHIGDRHRPSVRASGAAGAPCLRLQGCFANLATNGVAGRLPTSLRTVPVAGDSSVRLQLISGLRSQFPLPAGLLLAIRWKPC